MRLINANKLVVDARLGEDETPYVSKAQIDEAPTVEAIPIEWIEKWVEKYNKDLDPWFQGRTAVDDMLDDWEKENEINN